MAGGGKPGWQGLSRSWKNIGGERFWGFCRHYLVDSKTSVKCGFWLLLTLLAGVAVGKVVLADTLDPDCFWHLRVGGEIVRQGWPHALVDDLSFASIRQPWTPYSWLAEVAMKKLWDAGGFQAAVGVQAVMEAGFIYLLGMSAVELSRRVCGEPRYLASALAAAVGGVLSLAYLSFRPVTAALVILALIAWLLLRDRRMKQRSRAVWVVPFITVILINIHFFALLVPVWMGAILVGDVVDGRWGRDERRPRVLRDGILFLASLGACCCTPMLRGTIQSVLNYSASDVMVRSSSIAEFRPFYLGTMGKITAGFVIVLIFSVVWQFVRGILLSPSREWREKGDSDFSDSNFVGAPSPLPSPGVQLDGARSGPSEGDRKGDRREIPGIAVGEVLWLLGSAVLLFRMGRMSPVFAMIAAPMMAGVMPRLSDRILARPPVVAALAIVLAMSAWPIARAFPRWDRSMSAWLNRNGPEAPNYPCLAADFVDQHVATETHHILCDLTWGGFLEWRLGGRFQTLMDGRTQLFTAEFWKMAALGSVEQREHFLAATPADVAIVRAGRSSLGDSLAGLKWKMVYQDQFAKVLIPPGKEMALPNEESISKAE
jgi:hypothetical protein